MEQAGEGLGTTLGTVTTPMRAAPRLVLRLWSLDGVRVAVGTFGLALVYFLVPVRSVDSGVVWRLLAAALLLVGLSVLVVAHLRRQASRVSNLVLLLVVIVLAFALLFHVVATRNPGEFEGLDTRIDALYFTLTTMTTTGYGDVVPVGQWAKSLIIAVFVFDIVFLGLLISAIGQAFRRGRQQGKEHR